MEVAPLLLATPQVALNNLQKDEIRVVANCFESSKYPIDYGNRANQSWLMACGDALECMKLVPDSTLDCVITSPPYYWLRDYQVAGQYGLEDTVDDFINNLTNLFDETNRAMKKSGVLFVNIGDTYYSGKGKSHGKDKKSGKRRFGLRAVDKSGGLGMGIKPKSMIGIPWRFAISMMQRGWTLRSSIIWDRKHSLPESVGDRPHRNYEYVFMFVKDRKYYFDRQELENTGDEDIWTISARPEQNNGLATAPFPDELVRRCLKIGCPIDGLVADPFLGSGTTVRVALQERRSAIGFDLSGEFFNYSRRRVKSE